MEIHNDLKKKKEAIQNVIKNSGSLYNLNTQISKQDITILLGRTRAGKSTLANYLVGHKLTSVKEDIIGNVYKLEMLHTGQGSQIKKGSVSSTTIPIVHNIPGGGILIDSPGFEDNRGISQDIFNAICINHIRFANSVKFVLVCYIGDLVNDNIQNFTDLLEKIADLVENIEKIKNSVCIIFTKNQNDIPLDKLRTVMNDNILKQTELAVDKRLLLTLVENTNLIGLFKAPMREGKINVGQLDVNVKNAINACSYVNVSNLEIQFPLAEKSNVFLKDMYPCYTESTYFESEVGRTLEYIINYFNIEEYIFASYGKELHIVKHKLLKPLSIKLNFLLKNVINNLEELKLALEALLDVRKLKLSSEFKSHFEFILLLDNALLLEERIRNLIIKNYNNSTSKLLGKIQHVIDKIDAEFHRRAEENIVLFYEAKYFKDGFSTFSTGYKLAKAKIMNSVQTISNRMGTTETIEPLIPKVPGDIFVTGVDIAKDIAKVADAVIAGVAIVKSTTAKVAMAGAAVTAGAAAATAGSATVGAAAGAAATAAGAATAGSAASAAVASGVATTGAATAGAITIGAFGLGTVACGAGSFITGAVISSMYESIQYSLIKRSEVRREQKRNLDNEKYI